MTTAAGPAPWAPGSTVLAEFRVERQLGMGGFGRVDLVTSLRSGEQYAVKRMLAADAGTQRRLLTEARRWMDLPAHPHVTDCRFVRTAGPELAVFIEFVAGGSLADLIASGALYRPGPVPAQQRIVDLAVQVARGLDAAHSAGVLHLDMKPGNVLVTPDGVAKVTDFGLASTAVRDNDEIVQREAVIDYIAGDPSLDAGTREAIASVLRAQLFGADPERTIEGRAEGGTEAYLSPEQAEGTKVGRGADVWSWGLTVLAMFAGKRTWISGTLAAPALQRLLRRGAAVEIPPFVGELLGRCFSDDPALRPRSLHEAAETLTVAAAEAYGGTPGVPAPRRALEPGRAVPYERHLPSGARWHDPRSWLHLAYEAAGRDPSEAVAFWPTDSRSPRSTALGDLAAYVEAGRLLEEAVAAGRPETGRDLARVRAMTAMVRRWLGDTAAAIRDYRDAAEIGAAVGDEESRRDLIVTLTGLSVTLRETGDAAGAIAAADRAVGIADALPDGTDTYLARGVALLTRGNARPRGEDRLSDFRAAVDAVRDAEDTDEVRVQTVKALAAQASELDVTDRQAEARPLWQRIDAMLDEAIAAGRRDLLATKATTLHNRALVAADPAEQLRLAEAAADILRHLVDDQGRHALEDELAAARFLAAQQHEALGRPREAYDGYRAARLRYEQAVLRDGRTDLADKLALAYDYESTLAGDLESPAAGAELAQQAVRMWTRLAEVDGAAVWRDSLSDALVKRSGLLREAGDLAGARAAADRALGLLAGPVGDLDQHGLLALVRALGEVAAVQRAEGDASGAITRLRYALRLTDESLEDAGDIRPTILLRLGNALTDVGAYEAAADAFGHAAAAARESPTPRTRMIGALDAEHGRINALMRFGEYGSVVQAATALVDRYDGLISAGRDDLTPARARLRAVLGRALFQLGDVPAAAAALAEAGAELARQRDEQARAAGTVLARQAQDIRALLQVPAGQVAARLREYRGNLDLAKRMSQAGQVAEASYAVELHMAEVMALAQARSTVEVMTLCGEMGLAIGVMAAYAHREAAATHALQTAASCYLALYEADPLPEYLDRWCDSRIALGSIFLVRDEAEGLDALLDEAAGTVRRLDPRGSAARITRVRESIDSIRASLAGAR